MPQYDPYEQKYTKISSMDFERDQPTPQYDPYEPNPVAYVDETLPSPQYDPYEPMPEIEINLDSGLE